MSNWFQDRLDELNIWSAEHAPEIGWSAIITDGLNGGHHCRISAQSLACDAGLCLTALNKALEILAHGKETFIRRKPEVFHEKNFMHGTERDFGTVRFYVSPREGQWNWPKKEDGAIRYLPFR